MGALTYSERRSPETWKFSGTSISFADRCPPERPVRAHPTYIWSIDPSALTWPSSVPPSRNLPSACPGFIEMPGGWSGTLGGSSGNGGGRPVAVGGGGVVLLGGRVLMVVGLAGGGGRAGGRNT